MEQKSKELAALFAEQLEITADLIHPALSYQSIPQWDSMKHVTLMLALEKKYNVVIDETKTLELTDYSSIQRFILEDLAPAGAEPEQKTQTKIHRGLRDVYADTTLISHINGTSGELLYRGYPIDDVVRQLSFEQTAYLLTEGNLPSPDQLAGFTDKLVQARFLPPEVRHIITTMSGYKPIDVLRTCISVLGAIYAAGDTGQNTPENAREAGIRLISQLPMILGLHLAIREGREFEIPDRPLNHAEFVLSCLNVACDDPNLVHHFDNDLIVHAEHGSNASTFAARIATGAEADIFAGITAAIATFQGDLHGGAAEKVLHVLEEAKLEQDIAHYVRKKVEAGQPVMGFGHRVYRTEDPRVKHLCQAASYLSESSSNTIDLEVISTIKTAMAPYRRHGIDANVDLYAGVFYKQLGLNSDLAVPLFAISRVVGWIAQVIEQKENNILIRPRLQYVGEEKVLPKTVSEVSHG